MARRFIIDTDAGLDDASALFLAAEAHKAGVIDILAITAVTGNTKLENVRVNVARQPRDTKAFIQKMHGNARSFKPKYFWRLSCSRGFCLYL